MNQRIKLLDDIHGLIRGTFGRKEVTVVHYREPEMIMRKGGEYFLDGQPITKSEVDSMCESPRYHVMIINVNFNRHGNKDQQPIARPA